jgi:hypothetical protein
MDSLPLPGLNDVALHDDLVVLEYDLSGNIRIVLMEALLDGDGASREKNDAREKERNSLHHGFLRSATIYGRKTRM